MTLVKTAELPGLKEMLQGETQGHQASLSLSLPLSPALLCSSEVALLRSLSEESETLVRRVNRRSMCTPAPSSLRIHHAGMRAEQLLVGLSLLRPRLYPIQAGKGPWMFRDFGHGALTSSWHHC